jgi:chromosome segregation ATPase
MEKLSLALDVAREKEAMLSRELEGAREKTRHFGVKEMELNTGLADRKRQIDASEQSIAELQEELQSVKIKFAQLGDSYEYLENASKDQITKATEHVQGIQTEMAVMRANLQAEYIMAQEQSEQSFQKDIQILEKQVQDCKRKIEDRDGECQELTKLLDDERAEGDAMRLRLTLQASTHQNPSQNRPNDAWNHPPGTNESIPRLHIPSHLQAASSPMFSEDFGTVSIPGSPMNFKSPYFHVSVDYRLFTRNCLCMCMCMSL